MYNGLGACSLEVARSPRFVGYSLDSHNFFNKVRSILDIF
jgi:hypothetical protein